MSGKKEETEKLLCLNMDRIALGLKLSGLDVDTGSENSFHMWMKWLFPIWLAAPGHIHTE